MLCRLQKCVVSDLSLFAEPAASSLLLQVKGPSDEIWRSIVHCWGGKVRIRTGDNVLSRACNVISNALDEVHNILAAVTEAGSGSHATSARDLTTAQSLLQRFARAMASAGDGGGDDEFASCVPILSAHNIALPPDNAEMALDTVEGVDAMRRLVVACLDILGRRRSVHLEGEGDGARLLGRWLLCFGTAGSARELAFAARPGGGAQPLFRVWSGPWSFHRCSFDAQHGTGLFVSSAGR